MTHKLGTLHPVGAKVRHHSSGHDMLIVDVDEARGTRIVAWKIGEAVSEREFKVTELVPV